MNFIFGFVVAAVLLPLASAFVKGWRTHAQPVKKRRRKRRARKPKTKPPPAEFFLGPQLRVVWPDGERKAE